MRTCFALTGAIAVLLLGADPARSTERLVVTGSSTVAPLVAEIAKRYEESHPDVRIDVQTGGSQRGVNDARQGLADIGMASRSLKPEEGDLTPVTIASDGISIILHADNPVQELSGDQIVAIYTGKIRNWSELGGPDETIIVVNKAEGRSTLELFLEHFALKSNQIRADVIAGDNEQAIKALAGSPYAIGYVSIGNAEYDIGQGVPIKLLPLNGIPASRKTVASQTFPIVRPLNLVLAKDPSPLVQDFVAFATSENVRDIVESFFYVPPQSVRQGTGS